MIGWDVSWKYATFAPHDVQRLRGLGTPLAQFCVDIQAVLEAWAKENTSIPGFDLPDPIAMAVALDEQVATTVRELYVKVETHSELCRGQTVVDHLRSTQQPPNTRVVLEADRDRFIDMLHRAVAVSPRLA